PTVGSAAAGGMRLQFMASTIDDRAHIVRVRVKRAHSQEDYRIWAPGRYWADALESLRIAKADGLGKTADCRYGITASPAGW
ncbi:MAG: hypothetical protein LV473_21200, partial [Nitrospira sp.]|nr:hypothetical protein [Nitrospira sp.]